MSKEGKFFSLARPLLQHAGKMHACDRNLFVELGCQPKNHQNAADAGRPGRFSGCSETAGSWPAGQSAAALCTLSHTYTRGEICLVQAI